MITARPTGCLALGASDVTLVALFVQVYELTDKSSLAVGFIGLAQLVPMLFVSIGFGPQIDRRDRRRLLLFAQFGLMSASGLLLLGAYLEVDEARFGVQEIRFLYDSAAHPLKRAEAAAN